VNDDDSNVSEIVVIDVDNLDFHPEGENENEGHRNQYENLEIVFVTNFHFRHEK